MRPKIVFAILILAFAVLGTAVYFSPQVPPEPSLGTANKPAIRATSTSLLPEVPAVIAASRAPLVVTSGPPVINLLPAVQLTNRAVNAQERVAELTALAMNNDTNSLKTIWSELSNPDKEIRDGALAAVVQFGDRSVAPRLRELAAQTEDPAEKAGILADADYLELPSLTDLSRSPKSAEPK